MPTGEPKVPRPIRRLFLVLSIAVVLWSLCLAAFATVSFDVRSEDEYSELVREHSVQEGDSWETTEQRVPAVTTSYRVDYGIPCWITLRWRVLRIVVTFPQSSIQLGS